MTKKGSPTGPKMAPKSLQVGPKIGSQTICLHVNASSPSVRTQKPPRKPIWDRFGTHLGSIWVRFSKDFGQLVDVYRRFGHDYGLISAIYFKQHPDKGTGFRPRPRLF